MAKLNEVIQIKEAVDPHYIQALQRYNGELEWDIRDLQNGEVSPIEIGIGLINRSIEMRKTGEQLSKEK